MDTFRKAYRELGTDEKLLLDEVKLKAEWLLQVLEQVPDGRMKALAKTKLEETVMWAVKGITG